MKDATWTCHVCGAVRPDRCISVRTHDSSEQFGLPPGTVTENVRYCNDDPACVRDSQTYRHLPEGAIGAELHGRLAAEGSADDDGGRFDEV